MRTIKERVAIIRQKIKVFTRQGYGYKQVYGENITQNARGVLCWRVVGEVWYATLGDISYAAA